LDCKIRLVAHTNLHYTHSQRVTQNILGKTPGDSSLGVAHVGPLARTVRDAALLLGVVAGHARYDAFSLAGTVPDFVGACDLPVKGMRVA